MTRINGNPDRAGPQRSHADRGEDSQFRLGAPGSGSLEGRFVRDDGKVLGRHLSELKDRAAAAQGKYAHALATLAHIETAVEAAKARHRGGDRSAWLRLLIPVAIVAEGVTGFVGMEVLVSSLRLAIALAALAALVGAGTAGYLANRRLSQVPAPGAARVLEAVFVTVLTLLRYDSLHVQGADLVAAAGGAALAALISALGLLGIEEILVETRTFSMSLARLRAAWLRWRCARAAARLGQTRGRVEAAAHKLHQHFLDFLLKEGVALAEAQQRAAALRGALADPGTAP